MGFPTTLLDFHGTRDTSSGVALVLESGTEGNSGDRWTRPLDS